ncbi:MAG: response regulator [Bacteroidota bacterium]
MSNEVELLKQALERERFARIEAERLLEVKSVELFNINKELAQKNKQLEQTVDSQYSELQTYSSRLAALIGNLNSGIIVEDQNRNIILANQAFCNIFDIPAKPEQLNGMDCATLMQEAKKYFINPDEFAEQVNQLLQNKKAVHNEVLEMTSGKILQRDYIPIYLNNDYQGHLWQYIDVTDEYRLKSELEFIARFPDENPNPIMRYSYSGDLLYANPKAHAVFDSMSESTKESIKTAIITSIIQQKSHKLEIKVNEQFYSISFILFDDKKYVNLYFADITERKVFQSKLAEQKSFYETILNRIPTDIVVFDKDHRYLFVNPMGIKNPELRHWIIGKDDYEYCSYRNRDPKIAETRRASFNKAIESENGIEWEEHTPTAPDKDLYMYRRLFPVFNLRKELQMVIGFGLDITKIKLAEKRAAESLQAKEVFLANMSHEIRTPINGVLGLTTLLNKTTLNDQQNNYVQLIRQSADNLLVIINDILDFAKIESGKIELENLPFELNEVCANTVKALQYKAEEKGIKLLYSPLSEEQKVVSGDPFRLNQILLNLINNALKFTENGKVELVINPVEETNQNIKIRFEVHDTGIGIPDDFKQKIFDDFVQGSNDTSRKYGGTGLGLSICRKLIDIQKGRIWVESEVGKGSVFYFELDYIKSEQPLHSKNIVNVLDKKILSNLHVLIAEDNEINLFIAKSMLEQWGIKVDVANDGKIAVEKCKTNRYDLIIMDVQMPEMNGIEASKIIKTESASINTPILALTANAIKGDRERYLAEGLDDYLSKPFEEDDLYMKIASMLSIDVSASPHLTESETITKNTLEDPKLYSLEKLDQLAKGNKDFVRKMLELFVATVPEMVVALNKAAEEKNWKNVNAVCHKLKPTVQTMEINAIVEQVLVAEKMAISNPDEEILYPMVKQITNVLAQAVNQIEKDLNT